MTDDLQHKQAVETFRLALAAMGYCAFLLTDEEVWRWLQGVIAPMVQLRSDEIAQFAARYGESR